MKFKSDFKIVTNKEEDEHEELIKRSREVLQRHRGEASPGDFHAKHFRTN